MLNDEASFSCEDREVGRREGGKGNMVAASSSYSK